MNWVVEVFSDKILVNALVVLSMARGSLGRRPLPLFGGFEPTKGTPWATTTSSLCFVMLFVFSFCGGVTYVLNRW